MDHAFNQCIFFIYTITKGFTHMYRSHHISTNPLLIVLTLLMALLSMPKEASADWIGFWVRPKVDYVGGTNEVFDKLNTMGGGVEVGVEILQISLWGDYLQMGGGRYWTSGNIGFDFELGDKWQFITGVYAGGFLIGLGEAEAEAGLTDEQTKTLSTIPGFDLMSFESAYQQASAQEAQLLDKAGGLTGRVRLSFGRKIIDTVLKLSVGVQMTVGYHYVLSGLEASSKAKENQIDQLAKENSLPDDVVNQIKDELGITENASVDPQGINYSFGLYLNMGF